MDCAATFDITIPITEWHSTERIMYRPENSSPDQRVHFEEKVHPFKNRISGDKGLQTRNF